MKEVFITGINWQMTNALIRCIFFDDKTCEMIFAIGHMPTLNPASSLCIERQVGSKNT